MRALVTLLALVGCQRGEEEVGLGGEVDLSAPEQASLADAIGPGPLQFPVRLVNAWGVPVPGADATVDVDGVATYVQLDPQGYGTIALGAPGTYRVEDVAYAATAVAFDGNFEGLGLYRAVPAIGEAVAVAAAEGGVLVATGADVWFVGVERDAFPVLRFPDGVEVKGVRSGHIDNDGVLDAVAYGGGRVAVLRGRAGGGVSWVTGYEQELMTVADVALQRLDGDDLSDLVIAWHSGGTSDTLQVLLGDGSLGFTEVDPQPLQGNPQSIVVGRDGSLPARTITVLFDDLQVWRRYTWTDDGLLIGGPELGNLGIAPGFEVVQSGDVNGDGGDELVLAGVRDPSQPRAVTVYDFFNEDPTVIGLHNLQFDGAWVSSYSVNSDGRPELFAMEAGGGFHQASWMEVESAQRQVLEAPISGPFAHAQDDTAEVPPLFVAGEPRWAYWPGLLEVTGAVEFWEPVPLVMARWNVSLRSPLAAPTSEIGVAAGVVAANGNLAVRAWRVDPTDRSLETAAHVALPEADGGAPDLALCGPDAWVVTGTTLYLVNVVTQQITAQRPSTATKVTCGSGPGGAFGATLDAGRLDLLGRDLAVITTEMRSNAVDLAFADVGGGARVVTCETAGCTVVGWSLGVGAGAYAVGDAQEARAYFGSTELLLPAAGAVSAGDVTGDGTPDLVVTAADGGVVVFPASADGVSVGLHHHAPIGFVGPAVVGDGTGDFRADLFFADAAGQIYQSLAPADALDP